MKNSILFNPSLIINLIVQELKELSLLKTVDTECLKENGTVFIFEISRQPSIGFSNSFFLLKTEIHMQILYTKPFMCDLRGPGYLENKMWF